MKRMMTSSNNTPEKFEKFKADMIEAINSLEFEKDIHCVLIAGEGHDEPHVRMGCSCEGWLMKTAVDIIEKVTGSKALVANIGLGFPNKKPNLGNEAEEALKEINKILKKDERSQ